MSEEKSLAENASQPSSSAAGTHGDAESAPNHLAPAAETITEKQHAKDFKKLVPLAIFGIAALLFFVISGFWNAWINSVSLKTDDAYVRADVTPLSTRAHGIVLKTFVKDYERVSPGQVLIELRNEDFKDRVNEAEQTFSQVKIKLEEMKSRKVKLDSEIEDARAQLENSRTTALQFDTTAAIAKTAIEEAKANLESSAAAINQSQANLQSATADVVKSAAARKREEALLAEESSTQERLEQIVDEHSKALAALSSQQSAGQKAKAENLARKAQATRATQQLASIVMDQKRSFTVVKSREANLVAREMERKLLDGEEEQLKAELASKKSAVDSTEIDLGYTIIKAPAAGTVGELKVKPGQFVNAGTQIITLISATPWVVANFRETQTTNIKVGDKVQIDVDALPGRHWPAHVDSIAPASGAQFSLLPPENASGNFTKITQRIPIKIVFDAEPNKLTDLRPGMSVTASISAGSH